jgi:type I restriction enzyme S subunit
MSSETLVTQSYDLAMPYAPLGDMVSIQSGYAFKSEDYTSTGHFLVRISNVQDGEMCLDNSKYVTLDKRTKPFELAEGDILTSLTGNIGRVARIERSHLPAALNQRVARLLVKDHSKLDSEYLYHALSSPDFREKLAFDGGGAAQQNVSPKAIAGIVISLPPLDEQRRIAEVLRSVNEAIAANSIVAEKTRSQLADLGRELLPSPVEEPAPSNTRMRLLDICRPRQHPIIGKADLTESGYPVYGANGQIGYCHTYTHTEPVIAITCRGATCGTVNWVPAKSYVTGNAMALDEPDCERVHERFLYHYISVWGVIRSISGSAQPQITRQSLSCIDIVAPDIPRQREIADALDAIEREAKTSTDAIEGFRTMKSSLMSDLLSGHVRVPT